MAEIAMAMQYKVCVVDDCAGSVQWTKCKLHLVVVMVGVAVAVHVCGYVSVML